MLNIKRVKPMKEIEVLPVVNLFNRISEIKTIINRLRSLQALKLNKLVFIDETGGVSKIEGIPDALKVKIVEMLIDDLKQQLDGHIAELSKV